MRIFRGLLLIIKVALTKLGCQTRLVRRRLWLTLLPVEDFLLQISQIFIIFKSREAPMTGVRDLLFCLRERNPRTEVSLTFGAFIPEHSSETSGAGLTFSTK